MMTGVVARSNELPIVAIILLVCFGIPPWADVMILQSVKIDMHGRSNTAERQLLLKRNRLRIDADSENQYTATIVDLDAHTITQLDLIKKSGIVYSISTLRDIVNNKLLDLLTSMLGKPATVPHR